MTRPLIDFENMFAAYVECALWSSVMDDPLGSGHNGNFDDHFSADDLSEQARESMRKDCLDFVEYANADVALYMEEHNHSAEQLGHDFWLTRNGHGAGFWDLGLGDLGERLSKAAKTFGSSDLYACDDGKVYVS